MATLDEVGEQDGWRCWLCDGEVDPAQSPNDGRAPSIDRRMTDRKARKSAKARKAGADDSTERLAHRSCNTGKGNVDAIVPWPDHLFVGDPAVIIAAVERLANKGGREIFARCPTQADATETAEWLIDRISRLEPDLMLISEVQQGGGQFLVSLRT